MATRQSTPARPAGLERYGEVVATVDDYAEAQRIVDGLSDEGFPVENVAIVGRDLRFVETVTGRRGYGRATLEGASGGALTGAIVGLLLGIFSLWEPLVSWFALVVWWAVIGAIVGAILGAIGHALTRGRRDFSSVGSMRAGSFDVVVAPDHAERARELLGRGTARP